MSVQGLRVVVTGGTGVLGQAVATRLAEGGARAAVLSRTLQPRPALPPGVELVAPASLADEAAARVALDRAVASLGGLDALVNIAGGFVWESFEQADIGTWERMFETNLRTAVLASKAALHALLGAPRPAIVNVAAAGAQRAAAGMGAYAAAKSGVMRLTEAMAEEFKPRGLRVNAVLPGIIDTPANRAEMPDADFMRWVRPAELAEVILFLISPASSGITGALIPVTGRV